MEERQPTPPACALRETSERSKEVIAVSSEEAQRLAAENVIESAWHRIRGRLEERKDRILEEIRRYPRPIPACDLQFNTLLEERSGISRELNGLGDGADRGLATSERIARIDAFITASAFITGEWEQEIRTSIETAREMIEPPNS